MNWQCAGNGQLHQMTMLSVTNTLDCMHDQQIIVGGGCTLTEQENGNQALSYGNGQMCEAQCDPTKVSALDCMHDQKTALTNGENEYKYVIRRLTPIECARLQGFPDWWCDGANGSDSAQYKMWGNGIALPCAEFVLRRIVDAYRAEKE